MPTSPTPVHPKLRPLDIRQVTDQSQRYFLLRDPLGLTENVALVPEALGPLLAFCDGTRNAGALAAAYTITTGRPLTAEAIAHILESMSQALLLEDSRFAEAYTQARRSYHEAPFRPPALAGKTYPAEPRELEETLRRYLEEAERRGPPPPLSPGRVLGMISPHIDYNRGWPVYANVWRRAADAIADVELVIVFGTDHAGSPGRLTLTRQHYATPWGPLPTARPIVDALAAAIGEQEAFAEELHHRNEHSIELALVWLHYFLRPRQCDVVPILCGPFHTFVAGQADPAACEPFQRATAVLREASAGRRTLVVAAADLAHVGPAFGDQLPWDVALRAQLRRADEALLLAIAAGDAQRWVQEVRQAADRHRICGTAPVYMTLRLLAGAAGVPMAYTQCPADPEGGSLVSIAGALLQERGA